ncbi:hypothetical protein QQS21_004610 [Conoideocrella luteorostrata]|uniref:Uncharacterized protein n=1 Tax=Conoideocrella luteorostrata TaxID=1105319 RepID=A0AAJ0CR79_9HYPO|nr:hypothetical protein QQS21_004610 [Conoideocrella luteorostrata]
MKHSFGAFLVLASPFWLGGTHALPGGLQPTSAANSITLRHPSGDATTSGPFRKEQRDEKPAEEPAVVYRGDTRSPAELRALGGIPTEFGGPLRNESYGLEAHHRANCDKGKCLSAYTSTAKVFGSAMLFATDGGDNKKVNGWVYKIHATPNMIDMDNSGFKLYFIMETEFSALGGIRWDQIEGWMPAPASTYQFVGGNSFDELTFEDFQRDPRQDWPKAWIPNPEYNKKYDTYRASGGQPQLAGDEKNIKTYGEMSLEKYALEFMKKNGQSVGWTDGKSPFLNLTAPTKQWSGPSPLNDTSAAFPKKSSKKD